MKKWTNAEFEVLSIAETHHGPGPKPGKPDPKPGKPDPKPGKPDPNPIKPPVNTPSDDIIEETLEELTNQNS